MAIGGAGTPIRGSGNGLTVWKLEWTYGSGGAVTLDTAQSDRHPDVATPVADSGTEGITNITFLKCDRLWVLHASVEPPTADLGDGTDYVMPVLTAVSASAGTAVFRMVDVEGTGDLNDPPSGSRARLILLLERP